MIKTFLLRYQHLLKEGGWVFFGQVAVAIISLVGLRILTEIAPANLLGGATLWLGILTLIRNIFITPIGSTQIRFHPQYLNAGYGKWFDDKIKRIYLKVLFISVLLFIIFFFLWSYISSYAFNLLLLLILVLYYTLDAIKGFKINRLSAERKQKYAAIWQTIDVLLINVFFIVALLLVNNVESYLAGQSIGLLIGLIFFGFILFPKPKDILSEVPDDKEVKSKIFKYGLPFIPLAIVSWILNLGDRYIIENFLSLNEVGIYTAVYSIASRPFLMLGGILSGFFRPILFQRESNRDLNEANRTFKVWLIVAVIICICTLLIYAIGGSIIINILLSQAYSKNTFNVFLIIGGAYAIYTFSQIFENRLLSFGSSIKIIFPNVVAAIVNVVANLYLIPIYGIKGAAIATLLSFSINFVILFFIYFSFKYENKKTT